MNFNQKWLGGYFDVQGSCSFVKDSPSLIINNSNPKIAYICSSLFRKNNISSRITERSKPSKSSKKKRWDILIDDPKEVVKAAKFLRNYAYGKREQLDLIIEYIGSQRSLKYFVNKMKYLNQTNHILVLDEEKLWEYLKFQSFEKPLTASDENSRIVKDDFCDLDYLAGVLDGAGIIEISQQQGKYLNSDKFEPRIKIVSKNKEVVTKCFSTIKSLTGCLIKFSPQENSSLENNFSAQNGKVKDFSGNPNRISLQQKNYGKWELLVSGIMRVKELAEVMRDKLVLKKQQMELLYLYSWEKIRSKKNLVNDTGYSIKMALKNLDREI